MGVHLPNTICQTISAPPAQIARQSGRGGAVGPFCPAAPSRPDNPKPADRLGLHIAPVNLATGSPGGGGSTMGQTICGGGRFAQRRTMGQTIWNPLGLHIAPDNLSGSTGVPAGGLRARISAMVLPGRFAKHKMPDNQGAGPLGGSTTCTMGQTLCRGGWFARGGTVGQTI